MGSTSSLPSNESLWSRGMSRSSSSTRDMQPSPQIRSWTCEGLQRYVAGLILRPGTQQHRYQSATSTEESRCITEVRGNTFRPRGIWPRVVLLNPPRLSAISVPAPRVQCQCPAA